MIPAPFPVSLGQGHTSAYPVSLDPRRDLGLFQLNDTGARHQIDLKSVSKVVGRDAARVRERPSPS